MAVPAPALSSIAAAAGTAGPVASCLRCCYSESPGRRAVRGALSQVSSGQDFDRKL